MPTLLKHWAAIALASVEWIHLKLLSLLLVAGIMRESWRDLTGDAVLAVALRDLLILAMLLPVFALLRHRYALPTASTSLAATALPAQRARRWYAWSILAIPPLILLASVDQFATADTLSLVSWPHLAASLLGVASIALIEELLFRFALMGALLRAGMPIGWVLIVQAVIFVLTHGHAPFTGPHSLWWYAHTAFTFGLLYWVTRSLVAPMLLHFLLNLLTAQVSPTSYWLTHRTIESLQMDWTRACATAFLLVNLAYLLWLAADRWGDRVHWPLFARARFARFA